MATKTKQEIPQYLHDVIKRVAPNYNPGDLEIWDVRRSGGHIGFYCKPIKSFSFWCTGHTNYLWINLHIFNDSTIAVTIWGLPKKES